MPSHRDSTLIEQLEPRVLLSEVAWVGITAETGQPLLSYVAELVINDLGLITDGALNGADATGPGPDLDVPWSSFGFRLPSAFDLLYTDGSLALDNEFGAQFLTDTGHTAGWYAGYDDQFDVTDWGMGFLIEQPTDADLSYISGVWSMSMYQFSTSGTLGYGYNGNISITGSRIQPTLVNQSGQPPILIPQEITDFAADGVYVTNTGSVWYISANRRVLITADLSTNDGKIGIGIAVRPDVDSTYESVAGDYRLAIAPDKLMVDGGVDPVTESVLRLREDGTFDFYDMTAYDSGTLTSIGGGTYAVNDSTVTLVGDDGSTFNLEASLGGGTLVPKLASIPAVSSRTYDIVGLATLIELEGSGVSPRSDLITAIGQVRAAGPVVYEQRLDEQWYEMDLIALTGAPINPASVTEIEVFVDHVTDRTTAAVVANGELHVFSRGLGGDWRYTDFDFSVGVGTINSDITVFDDLGADATDDSDNTSRIAMVDSTGDLIFFTQTGLHNVDGNSAWTIVNLTDTQLTPNGFNTPTFSVGLSSYVQPWNGQGVIGLDLVGNLWAIWWAPWCGASWASVNLSFPTGLRRLVGTVDAFVQPNGATSLVGTDISGDVHVTSWAPGFSHWHTENFSDYFSMPSLRADSLTAFVNSWGGATIAGIDTTGEVVYLWWAPGMSSWVTTDISESLAPSVLRPSGQLDSYVTETDLSEVWGTDTAGDLVRFSWEPGDADWSIDNVTQLAV